MVNELEPLPNRSFIKEWVKAARRGVRPPVLSAGRFFMQGRFYGDSELDCDAGWTSRRA